MHAKRARLPQKRPRSKKPSAKKSTVTQQAELVSASPLGLPLGVADLAAQRARRRPPQPVELTALVEWIAPARDCWRRGELEVRRSATMPMLATRGRGGGLTLTDLPGQGMPLEIRPAALAALAAGRETALCLALPGMRVTLTADDLAPVLPVAKAPAQILAFRPRP